MIAVDIFEVPMSKNHYLLVVQDYFTKWAEAIPQQDQTAAQIATELIKLFSVFRHPDIVHSNHGRTFESAIVAQTLELSSLTQQPTTPRVMVWWNISICHYCCFYACMLTSKKNGNDIYLWSCRLSVQQHMYLLAVPQSCLCLAVNHSGLL